MSGKEGSNVIVKSCLRTGEAVAGEILKTCWTSVERETDYELSLCELTVTVVAYGVLVLIVA